MGLVMIADVSQTLEQCWKACVISYTSCCRLLGREQSKCGANSVVHARCALVQVMVSHV